MASVFVESGFNRERFVKKSVFSVPGLSSAFIFC